MATKVFVDLDEEIIFTTEKIRKADGDQIALVVPDRSALLGSVVTLKLLAQEVAKLKKDVILVTEDEIGISLAKKAQLTVVGRAGEITDSLWNEAHKARVKLEKSREITKDMLVSERTAKGRKSEKKEQVQENELEVEEEPIEEEAKPEVPKVPEKYTVKPQMVNIDGFEMVSGGDIAEVDTGAEDKHEVLEKMSKKPLDDDLEKMDIDDEMAKTKREESEGKHMKSTGLIGKDINSYRDEAYARKFGKKGTSGTGIVAKAQSTLSSIVATISEFFSKGGNRPKLFLIGGGALVLFLLFSYFILPTGKVVVYVESQDVQLEKNIIADTATVTLDTETLTIPAETLEETKDRSLEEAVTGTEKTGEKASGTVSVYNKTTSAITIQAGTVIESIETGLKYQTTAAVTVKAVAEPDDPDGRTPGSWGYADVGVQATNFGEEYNIQTKQEFRITGFDVENVYAKNFNNIAGGTTTEKRVVSQEDYDNLKTKLEEELKAELIEALKTKAGEQREMLEQTITYETVKEELTPTEGVGAEAETLTIQITMKATALAFSKDSIDQLSQSLIEQENDQQVEIEEFKYGSEVTKTEGTKIYIKLTITGIVTPSVGEDVLKNELKGKTKGSAEEYLKSRSEIQDFSIDLGPSWLPAFLSHFPNSASKIKVEVKKV